MIFCDGYLVNNLNQTLHLSGTEYQTNVRFKCKTILINHTWHLSGVYLIIGKTSGIRIYVNSETNILFQIYRNVIMVNVTKGKNCIKSQLFL